jgi:hypothetical protein
MCKPCVHVFVLESDYGNSVFTTVRPISIFDIFHKLSELGRRPSTLTEAKGVARCHIEGSFTEVFELESALMIDPMYVHEQSSLYEAPVDYCPVLASLARLTNRSSDARSAN